MPNGHSPKQYGGHRYANSDRTSDCEYGCGCWMGPVRSGGPTGLDPAGACPNNPKDGKFLGGNADYDHVVTERIHNLNSRLRLAENRLKQVSPSKAKLAHELSAAKTELAEKNMLLAKLRRLIGADA